MGIIAGALTTSRLTQARGLKRHTHDRRQTMITVAPHAGAWIETHVAASSSVACVSRLTQARGLKRPHRSQAGRTGQVAPHAGAWIETISGPSRRNNDYVAPHAGAWIETPSFLPSAPAISASRLTQARGLKRCSVHLPVGQQAVAPHAGAWIETFPGMSARYPAAASRLTQARGLKRQRPVPARTNGYGRASRRRVD